MTTTLERIGFMQGRLSAMVDGKIQAFPWSEWREEFPRAHALGLSRIEWANGGRNFRAPTRSA